MRKVYIMRPGSDQVEVRLHVTESDERDLYSLIEKGFTFAGIKSEGVELPETFFAYILYDNGTEKRIELPMETHFYNTPLHRVERGVAESIVTPRMVAEGHQLREDCNVVKNAYYEDYVYCDPSPLEGDYNYVNLMQELINLVR